MGIENAKTRTSLFEMSSKKEMKGLSYFPAETSAILPIRSLESVGTNKRNPALTFRGGNLSYSKRNLYGFQIIGPVDS
jgi:hypothetical protein